MVASDTEITVAQQPKAAVKKWVSWAAVLLAVAWTGYSFVAGHSDRIMENLSWEKAAFLMFVFFSSEVCFVVGAIVAALGTGREIFRGSGYNPIKWFGAVIATREHYREIITSAANNKSVVFGFYLNWIAAVTSGVVGVLAVLVLLPFTAWTLLVFPVMDIAASFAWRIPVKHHLEHRRRNGVILRDAALEDVSQIVELDASRYDEEIVEGITDDPVAMFRQRIINSEEFFWVAEINGRIEGLLACQRSKYRPKDFVSWDHCTNFGTFEGTGDDSSNMLYVAAMTTREHVSKLMVFERLLAHGVGTSLSRGVTSAFFSGRMPGLHKWLAENPSGTVEQYYNAIVEIDGKQVALDRQIRRYESFGMKRIRLVENGFVEDWESCGYAVLFLYNFPMAGKPLPKLWGWFIRWAAKHPKVLAHF